MAITSQQFIVGATIPMFTGSLSVLGSATIIFMVLRSREKLSSTYHRILFGMSSMDIMYSFGLLLSTVPFPRDTPSLWDNLYGTTTTCTIQGVMVFSGNIGSNMYNCSLATFYMLTIVYGVRDEVMKTRIEPCFHALPLIYVIGANIFLLIKKSFNPVLAACLITPYPRGCHLNPDVPCTRGENAAEHFWIFHGWPVIAMFFSVLFIMGKLYYTVRAQEKKMQSYQITTTLPESIRQLRNRTSAEPTTSPSAPSTSLSFFRNIFNCSQPTQGRQSPFARRRREAMIQCFLYVLAYFVSYIFVTIYQLAIKRNQFIYSAWVLTQITTPLQGLLNFCVFVRPRIIAALQAENDLTLAQAFVKAITSTMDANTPSDARRRQSLQNTQQNGGSGFTAREFHLRELRALANDSEEESQDAKGKRKHSPIIEHAS
jgi:hypothetical protein